MSFSLEAAGKTDVGLVRTNNEDNFGFDLHHGVFVVCDGMGGQAAGEVASKTAVDTVLHYFRHDLHDSQTRVFGRPIHEVSIRANRLANAVQLANQAIRNVAGLDPARAGMGSTIVAVSVGNKHFSVAHVGDSRVYLMREGVVQQLTSDHSLVMEQVRRGILTEEEAERSTLQNVIVRALGSDESVEPDLQDRELIAGDVLLLCTDGFSRYVQDSATIEVLQSGANLQTACEELIRLAKAGKSNDNITCLLLRVKEPWWKKRLVVKF